MKLDAKTLKLDDDKNERIFFDDMLPGFGLRLRRSGNKVLRSWIVQYRHAGKQSRMRLGDVDVVGTEQARIAARKILARVQLGEDPQADRADRREKDQFSFHKVAAEFLAAKRDTVRPRSHFETSRYLTSRRYFKALHSLAIDKITRRDIAAHLVAIKRDSGTITARAAKAAISSFFTWCLRMGLLESNPVIGTEDFKPIKRDRVLTDVELAAVWNACDGNDDYDRIIRLLILTGCRRQEVGGMARESELDTDTGKWTIPKERSKNHQPHMLPLPAAAWDIINAVPPQRDHLFGSHHGVGFTNWYRAKRSLDDKLDGVADWHLHDIRRTVATGMGNIGIMPHIIEEILNHKSGHKAGVAGI
jgi:integrase